MFYTFFQDSRKLRQSAGAERRKLSYSGTSGRGSVYRESKVNAKLMQLSREGAKERRSLSAESQNMEEKRKRILNLSKKKRKSPEMRGGVEERSKREDFIANAKSQPCMFFAKGYCMRGTSCWFSHEKQAQMPHVEAGADRMEKGSCEETRVSREPRHLLLRLVDHTVTVKTLDLEEYFFEAWRSAGGEVSWPQQ